MQHRLHWAQTRLSRHHARTSALLLFQISPPARHLPLKKLRQIVVKVTQLVGQHFAPHRRFSRSVVACQYDGQGLLRRLLSFYDFVNGLSETVQGNATNSPSTKCPSWVTPSRTRTNIPGLFSSTEYRGTPFLMDSRTPGFANFFLIRCNASVLRSMLASTDALDGFVPDTVTLPNFTLYDRPPRPRTFTVTLSASCLLVALTVMSPI